MEEKDRAELTRALQGRISASLPMDFTLTGTQERAMVAAILPVIEKAIDAAYDRGFEVADSLADLDRE